MGWKTPRRRARSWPRKETDIGESTLKNRLLQGKKMKRYTMTFKGKSILGNDNIYPKNPQEYCLNEINPE